MSKVNSQIGVVLGAKFDHDNTGFYVYVGNGTWDRYTKEEPFSPNLPIHYPSNADIKAAEQKQNIRESFLLPVFEKSGFQFIIPSPLFI